MRKDAEFAGREIVNAINDTTSKTEVLPAIKTDLVFPLRILEIYQEHLVKIINEDYKRAKRDTSECDLKLDADPNNVYVRIERGRATATMETLRRVKSFMYIPWNTWQELLGQNYYLTRELRLEQKKQIAWRNRVLLNDNLTCRKCHSKNDLEAHHIYAYKYEPDLRYDPNNGVTLCSWCHKAFHSLYGNMPNMVDLIAFLDPSTVV